MREHILYLLGPMSVGPLKPRYVRVYEPPKGPTGPRPVLYLFDGQNIFHDAPSFAGGWHLHRTVNRLSARGGRLPLVVGIDHGGEARLDELSPFAAMHSQGQLDVLLAWLVNELMPLICRDFGASEAPWETGIGGSSMGGLAAIYAHFRYPERFGKVMSMSPSLMFAGGSIYDFIASQPVPPTSRIYLDAGALEAKGHVLTAARRLELQLRARGYDERSLRFVAARRGGHNEACWRKRAPRAICFLFS